MRLYGPLLAYFKYFRHEILAKVGKFYNKHNYGYIPHEKMSYIFGVNDFKLCFYFFLKWRKTFEHEVIWANH